jgi:hypothetical protein
MQKHHKKGPDLASARYTKDTFIGLEEFEYEYVPKEENPPNVPQLCYGPSLFLGLLEKEGYRKKKCKVHDGKNQKSAEV